MKNSEQELKSCAHCGGEPTTSEFLYKTGAITNTNEFVRCADCGCLVSGKTIQEAIASWNTRHIPINIEAAYDAGFADCLAQNTNAKLEKCIEYLRNLCDFEDSEYPFNALYDEYDCKYLRPSELLKEIEDE